MEKLTIPFRKPQIEINGVVFDVLKSDGEVFSDALALAAKYETLDTKDTGACIEAAREIGGYVDAMLGDGALRKMNEGREPCLLDAVRAMMTVSEALARSYMEKLGEYA